MAKKTSRMSRKEARSGSKATCTASACPVRPVHTSRYVGFGWRPPMYPDSTESTPSIPSYTASRHQKHPPASVVVSRLDMVLGYRTGGGLDFHFVAHAQEETAGIPHPPLHIRDGKVRPGGRLSIVDPHFDGQRDFVGRAVDAKHSVHLNLRRAVRSDHAIDAIRREDDLRILRAFENLLVHAAVARIVAARAAGGVHRHFARDLAGGGIEADGAARELEAAVHRVQSGRQCESHVGV